jgi:very-short-patch-repair endonuclease
MIFLPIMVLAYQAAIVATLLLARLHSRKAATIAALGWSTTTLILVFMPWLILFQLGVIWVTRHLLVSSDRLELPEGDISRRYAAVAAICVFAGFLMPPLFGVAGFAGWAAWRRIRNDDRFDGPVIPLAQVTPNTPRWISHYVRACESPAESAFLKAMISRYRLKPNNGSLRTQGLVLEMQKPIGRYRADFVANGRLVVEIDGARWHGSREAQARDAQRDRDMRGMGLEVLRIPAKTVFRTPKRAVRLVEEAAA